jgi:hypothetical protein
MSSGLYSQFLREQAASKRAAPATAGGSLYEQYLAEQKAKPPRSPFLREPGSAAADAGAALGPTVLPAVGRYIGEEVQRGGAELVAQAREAGQHPAQFAKSVASGLFHAVDDPLQTVGKALRYPFTRSAEDVTPPAELAKAVLMGTALKATGPAGEAAVDAAAPVLSSIANAMTRRFGATAGAATEMAAKKAISHAGSGATFMVGADPDHPISSAIVGSVAGPVLGFAGEAAGKAVKPGLRKVGGAASKAAETASDVSSAAQKLPDAAKRYLDKWKPKAEATTPAAQQPTPTPTTGLHEGAVTIRRMPVEEIHVDPERFQFKRGTDAETGTGSELKGLSKFDEQLAGVVSVWRDPADGKTYAVNGHHRLELAKRTGHPSINVQELPARNAEEAKAQGALANIAEGRGTALDAAQFFRSSGLGIDDLRDRVSFKGAIAKSGLGLSKLAPDLFDRVARGEIPENHGAVVGSMLDTPELQRTALGAIESSGKRLSDPEVAEVARQVRDAGTERVSQETLFGTEDVEVPLYVERAQLAAAIKKRLAGDKRLFGYVSKEGRAEGLSRAGNVIDVEGSRRIADEAAQLEEVFNQLYTRKGPIADALTAAARRIANGEKAGGLVEELYPAIRQAVQEAHGRGEGEGYSTSGIGNQNREPEAGPEAAGRQTAGTLPEEIGEGRVPDSTDPSQAGFSLSPEDFNPGSFRTPRDIGEGVRDVSLSPSEEVKVKEPERIEVHAFELPDGTVVEGKYHGDALRRAMDAGLLTRDEFLYESRGKFGFVTSTGRFVEDGPEALFVAIKADQLRRNTKLYRSIQEGHTPLSEMSPRNVDTKIKGIGKREPKPLNEEQKQIAGYIGDDRTPEQRGTGQAYDVAGYDTGEPQIVSRALKFAEDNEVGFGIREVDGFAEDGSYIDRHTGKPMAVVEGYQLSDGTFITRQEAAERFPDADFGPEGRNAEGPLYSPAGPDLFGNEGEPAPLEGQSSLFDERAGTEASRPLTDAERAATGRIAKLRQVLALETDPQRRVETARELVQLEKLVNRGQMISPDEMAARVIAEHEEGSPPTGPDQAVLFSPAAQISMAGARIRRALGIKNSVAGDVVALRKISLGLADAVGVPVREGRGNLKRRRALGAFWQKSEMIRVRRLKDLSTVTHEIGHYLSKKYGYRNLIRSTTPAQRKAVQAELLKMGHDLYGSRTPAAGYAEEGVAQFFSFFVTDRQRMMAEAPNTAAYMDGLLQKEPALLDALNKANENWTRYEAAPANAKIGSMIERGVPSLFENTDPARIVDHWFNDLAPIARATEALGSPQNFSENAAILARLTKGDAGRARDILDNGVIDFATRQRVTRGLKDILRDVGEKDRDAFTEFLVSRQVLTKTNQGIDTGFDVAAAREVVNEGTMNAGWRQAATEIWQFRSALLDYLEGAGLMTKPEVAAIKHNNPTPTPFYRSFEANEEGGGTGRSSSLARSSAGIHKMRGSDRPIIDPLQSIVSDTYRFVDIAQKHHAAATLLKAAISTEGGARIATVLTEMPMEARRIGIDRVADQLRQAGWTPPDDPALIAALGDITLEAFYEKKQGGAREARDRVLPVLINGERKWIQVNDQATWEAIQNMTVSEIGPYERIITAPTRALRMGATQANPDFALVNPFRDAFTASIYSQAPGINPPGSHLLRGVAHLLKSRLGGGDEIVDRWAQEGGENAGMVGADKRTMAVAYQKQVSQLMASPTTRLKSAILNPVRTMRDAFEIFENATRVGEFAKVRAAEMKKGVPEIEASTRGSLHSRDVSQDFFLAGSTARVVNRYVPFFTAQLGDIRKLAIEFDPRNIIGGATRKRMTTVTARAIAYVTIPSLYLYLSQKDDPAYQEIPEYYKANAWVLVDREHGPIPFTTESGEKIRVWAFPRPYLLGYLFGYTPEKLLEWANTHDPDAVANLGKQLWSAFVPPIVPTILGPLIENYANKSLFTGRPIVPQHTQGLDPSEQVTPYTGEAARIVGKAIHYSPAKIENLVRGYTGGAGLTVKEIADAAIREGRSIGGFPQLRTSQPTAADPLDRKPVIGRFILPPPGANSKTVTKLFSDFEEAERKRQTVHRMLAEGRRDQAIAYMKGNYDEIMSVATQDDAEKPGALRLAHKAMGDITAKRREIAESDASSEEKDRQERELEREMVTLARLYYESVKDGSVGEIFTAPARRPRLKHPPSGVAVPQR